MSLFISANYSNFQFSNQMKTIVHNYKYRKIILPIVVTLDFIIFKFLSIYLQTEAMLCNRHIMVPNPNRSSVILSRKAKLNQILVLMK